jgi:myo-inositol-1(or 4)-monophosphatase
MDVALEVARRVRAAVLPHLGSPEHRGAAGTAAGGDVTFGIDEIAENAAERVLEDAAAAGGLAWYTEDRGLVVRGEPERLVVVDPIDGTRPAGAGLEAACVSVASAAFDEAATLSDVDDAVIVEIKTGTLYRAKRGKGVRIIDGGETREPSPSRQAKLDGAFWTYGFRGRPAMASVVVLEEMLDGSGVSGGVFELGSATFGMMGVVTGRFDAYVDHGQRLIDDVPATKSLFEDIAGGAILNNSPYDIAAALLIAKEAGCVVTDAAGDDLGSRPLVGSGDGFTVSTLAVCTPDLHADIVSRIDRGIDRLRGWDAARGA